MICRSLENVASSSVTSHESPVRYQTKWADFWLWISQEILSWSSSWVWSMHCDYPNSEDPTHESWTTSVSTDTSTFRFRSACKGLVTYKVGSVRHKVPETLDLRLPFSTSQIATLLASPRCPRLRDESNLSCCFSRSVACSRIGSNSSSAQFENLWVTFFK